MDLRQLQVATFILMKRHYNLKTQRIVKRASKIAMIFQHLIFYGREQSKKTLLFHLKLQAFQKPQKQVKVAELAGLTGRELIHHNFLGTKAKSRGLPVR